MRILKSNPLLNLVNAYIIDSPQPSNISYMWNMGSLLAFCLGIQIITGITLAMHYNPSIIEAFNSVEHIMRDVNNGWLVRYLHANTASAFFFLVYLHIGRGLYYGSYKSPRTMVWSIGTIILIAMMATAFLGYVLPYGQMSLWGATVITNLMSAIPWIGQDIVQFIWGGFSVNNATLNRFFSLHFVLPFIIAALVLMHLISLHDTAGSNNPLGISGNYDRLPFAPFFIFKDLITIFLFIFVISLFVFFLPNVLGDSENYVMANPMQTPPAIVPEWYLLPFYAILRSIPNKLLGVIAMFSAILIILTMAYTDLSRSRGMQFRPLSKICFYIFVLNFLILMQLGAKHVESPYIEFGQISTILYFSHFLIIVPIINFLENSFVEIDTAVIISNSEIPVMYCKKTCCKALSQDRRLELAKRLLGPKFAIHFNNGENTVYIPYTLVTSFDVMFGYKTKIASRILKFVLYIIVYETVKYLTVIITSNMSAISLDAPRPWGIYFQNSATPQMEGIMELHDNIMFYLVIVLFAVGWILTSILKKYSNLQLSIPNKHVNHGTLVELIWTITPALILILIAFPSFKLLYLMDEISDPVMAVLAEGHQWYWSYQYPDFLNSDNDFIEFDSYLVPESDLEEGTLRMLEVDNRVIVPELTHIRFIITAADVIHSYACPALGIKCDAYPGRLNQVSVFINREGTFYGQCSEICGVLHSSMPIVIESVSVEKFLSWLGSQDDNTAIAFTGSFMANPGNFISFHKTKTRCFIFLNIPHKNIHIKYVYRTIVDNSGAYPKIFYEIETHRPDGNKIIVKKPGYIDNNGNIISLEDSNDNNDIAGFVLERTRQEYLAKCRQSLVDKYIHLIKCGPVTDSNGFKILGPILGRTVVTESSVNQPLSFLEKHNLDFASKSIHYIKLYGTDMEVPIHLSKAYITLFYTTLARQTHESIRNEIFDQVGPEKNLSWKKDYLNYGHGDAQDFDDTLYFSLMLFYNTFHKKTMKQMETHPWIMADKTVSYKDLFLNISLFSGNDSVIYKDYIQAAKSSNFLQKTISVEGKNIAIWEIIKYNYLYRINFDSRSYNLSDSNHLLSVLSNTNLDIPISEKIKILGIDNAKNQTFWLESGINNTLFEELDNNLMSNIDQAYILNIYRKAYHSAIIKTELAKRDIMGIDYIDFFEGEINPEDDMDLGAFFAIGDIQENDLM